MLSPRSAAPGDDAAIRRVLEAAFGGAEEADLVERLRAEQAVLLSLVAEAGQEVAGHALFSRMYIDTPQGPVAAVALAPVGVLPAWQRTGIGQALIRTGLEQLREAGEGIVTVLGNPAYYTRFGFTIKAAAMLSHPFPREYYMAMELVPGALTGAKGGVRYAAAFGL